MSNSGRLGTYTSKPTVRVKACFGTVYTFLPVDSLTGSSKACLFEPQSAMLGFSTPIVLRPALVSSVASRGQTPSVHSVPLRTRPIARFNFNVSGGHDRYAEWAAELFGMNSHAAEPPKQSAPSPKFDEEGAIPEHKAKAAPQSSVNIGPDFRTAWDSKFWFNQEDMTAREVSVSGLHYVNGSRDILEVEVDVSGTTWDGAHTRPGMFCQVAVGKRRAVFTIASRPEKPGVLSFLTAIKSDSVGFAKLKLGSKVRISPVIGKGLELHMLAAKGMKNLYVLVDSVQGYAAVRSFLDWEAFRSASGEGMNRTTRATVLYALPTAASLPDSTRQGEWAMWGINVVPVVGQSLIEYLRGGGLWSAVGGGPRDQSAGALACVTELYEAERLFSELCAKGVQRERFCMYTEHRVMNEVEVFNGDEISFAGTHTNPKSYTGTSDQTECPSRPFGMPDDVFQYVQRQCIEDQIWRAWVHIREPMREEFERRWDHGRAGSRSEREKTAAAAEKKQAWESWFMRNKDAWNSNNVWDDVSWGAYWQGWKTEQDKWGAAWGEKTAKNPWAAGGSAWNQQKSQEFWDQAYGGGAGGPNYASSSDRYGDSSGSWGASSTHSDPRGYRYTYEEPPGDNSSYSSASSSGGRQQAWRNANEKSYTNSAGRSKKSRVGGGGRGEYGFTGFNSSSSDFYTILDVNSDATGPEIKKAYRKAALANHPDLNPGPGSTERMQAVVVAYMTLKDAAKRQQYDRYGM